MLYIMFFLLVTTIRSPATCAFAIPLEGIEADLLSSLSPSSAPPCAAVMAVAAIQGALGDVRWCWHPCACVVKGTLMAFFILLPAVGAALVLSAGGRLPAGQRGGQGGWGLIVFGVVVIGLVDNILRHAGGAKTPDADYVC
jgi:hypothetical protein